jgi:hypothetical protein
LVGGYFNVVDNVISVIIPSLYHSHRPAGNRGIPPFLRSSVVLSLGVLISPLTSVFRRQPIMRRKDYGKNER